MTYSPRVATLSPSPACRSDQTLSQRISECGSKLSYEKGATFFAQGGKPEGIFLLVAGSVKLSMASSDGRTLILGFPRPGAVLGLAATILGSAHESTAETVEAVTAVFVPRLAFLKLVQERPRTTFEVAELLSERCKELLNELRTIGLCESAQQRLATFLLGFRSQSKENGGYIRLPGASQEDLAQMVGLSRETASRLLTRLKKRRVLDWKRSTLVVRDWGALQKLAAEEGNGTRKQSSSAKALILQE
jgi:CRP/FNR family transcriptional regulator, cyclic AMP receptor protein